MTEDTIDSNTEDPENHFVDDELVFKTASFIQNDLLLSLIFLGLIIFVPLIVWNHVDHYLIFTWQGCMIAISTTRWLCRYTFVSQKDGGSLTGFWSGILIFLTLLDGLGWGISGALFFPADSTLTMSLIALLLIGVGGVGAVSYSARMLVAIPYLFCVVSPFVARLYFTGGNDEFMIASALVLLTAIFCFAADRLNLTLSSALEIDNQDDEVILALEEKNQQLKNAIQRETNRSKNLEVKMASNLHELEEVHNLIAQYNGELHLLAGKSINLLNDLASLKQTDMNHKQNQLLLSIEENVMHLSNILNEDDEDNGEQFPIDITDNHQDQIEPAGPEIKNVLIVDDDKGECQRIESCLRTINNLYYKTVDNVSAALTVLCEAESSNSHFDLVIAKMWMPEMDGLGFAECLQDDAEFRDIKFILISSGEVPSEKQLQKIGVSKIIGKPLNTAELSRSILGLIYGDEPSGLPTSIEIMIENAVQTSLHHDEQNEQEKTPTPIIDQYVIEGLRSSTTINFIETVNDFLEDAPILIEQAKNAYMEKSNAEIKNIIREFGSRSLHMGAFGLVESAKEIEATINDGGTERIISMLQSIDVEFIQVESALLVELTEGMLLSNEIKH